MSVKLFTNSDRSSNKYSRITAIFTLIICLFSSSIAAEQIQFSKVEENDNYRFSYQWLDHDKTEQSLSFLLSKSDLFQRYRSFSAYQPHIAQEYVQNALKRHLRKKPISGVQISFSKQGGEYATLIKSPRKGLIKKAQLEINQLQHRLMAEYLTDHYYHQFLTPDNILAVKPDHSRIAHESAPVFKGIKETVIAKASVKNIRRVSNFVLSFVQSIPYSTLESRVSSSGAGFNPPFKLLWENQGDCDSKVTLTAALLRMLMPRIKMVLVFIDNHALIGIDVAAEADNVTVDYEGTRFVLAEPTGPELMPLGNIAEQSKLAIYSGRYSLEPFYGNDDDTEE